MLVRWREMESGEEVRREEGWQRERRERHRGRGGGRFWSQFFICISLCSRSNGVLMPDIMRLNVSLRNSIKWPLYSRCVFCWWQVKYVTLKDWFYILGGNGLVHSFAARWGDCHQSACLALSKGNEMNSSAQDHMSVTSCVTKTPGRFTEWRWQTVSWSPRSLLAPCWYDVLII